MVLTVKKDRIRLDKPKRGKPIPKGSMEIYMDDKIIRSFRYEHYKERLDAIKKWENEIDTLRNKKEHTFYLIIKPNIK